MKLQDTIAAEFNEFSKDYTNDMVRCVPHYLKLLGHFSHDLPSNFNPKQILDLGCGNGNITSQLLKQYPNAHVTLLDASDKMLELCKAQFGTKSKNYVQSYFQDYNFKTNGFNLIAAGFSLHHCNANDKQTLFKSIYKALKPNGVLAYSDLMINRNSKTHQQLIQDWNVFVNSNYPDTEKWNWIMNHYKTYDHPDSLKKQLKWLQQAGFSNFKISIYDRYWVHLKAFKA
jgi:ubiquinone/menaquinone biosynthesis C-methylase UbiE